jgi:hypothetical protein
MSSKALHQGRTLLDTGTLFALIGGFAGLSSGMILRALYTRWIEARLLLSVIAYALLTSGLGAIAGWLLGWSYTASDKVIQMTAGGAVLGCAVGLALARIDPILRRQRRLSR